MVYKNLILTLITAVTSFNNLLAQNYDWKTKNALGSSFSEVNNDLGAYKCKSDANSVTYCFYGDDNEYDCKGTTIIFTFENLRVSSIMFIWEHYTQSAAIADKNYEKNRLTNLYGRPEIKDGVFSWFTNRALILCGNDNLNRSYIRFSNY